MALVKFSAVVSEARGKEGGVIFSRNTYGSYIKSKVSPTNPQTIYQQTQRGTFTNIAQTWRTLTEVQKASWTLLGQQATRVNIFGDQTNYSGFSVFMKCNRNRVLTGQAILTTAPTLPTIPSLTLTNFTAVAGVASMTVVFTPTPVGATNYLAVYITPQILGGRRFVKNYRRLLNVTVNAASPLALLTPYNARFGTLVAARYIAVACKIIDGPSGFDAGIQPRDVIVAA
jgi:hypothetical protein